MWVARNVHDLHVLSGHLNAADVYTFPSRHERFCVAASEAIACGLPVVAADVSGLRDIFPGGEASGGIVVPAHELCALREALARLLAGEALRVQLDATALARARAASSLDAVGAQLQKVILGGDAR